MKDRIVPQEEIDNGYIAFCKDLGAKGETRQEIEKYLKKNNVVIEQKEDNNLIWFELIKNGRVKYYSNPIMKYVQEYEKEIRCVVKADVPSGQICLPFSALPIYNFNKKRKNKIPPIEKQRNERESHIDSYQRHINHYFESSVFGYILFDGRTITCPDNKHYSVTLEYRGKDKDTVDYYKDTELLKELLSNKDKYTWYELEDKYFIVRNSNKKEYMYLANEETQEIKLVKIVGDKVILKDIVKDELTLSIEKEIDECLKKSSIPVFGRPYVRFSGNCFEIIKLEKIPVKVEKKEYAIFQEPDYRIEGRYEKINTKLTLDEIEKVVVGGNKYKWFKYRGKLYIAWMFGKSEMNVLLGDYIEDFDDAPKCKFNYDNSPEDLVVEFIKNGIWDGDKIIEKYNCSQECIDNIVRELIHFRHIEKNADGSNKYKIVEHRGDLSILIFYIENQLQL